MSNAHSKRRHKHEHEQYAYIFSLYAGQVAEVLGAGDLDDESRDSLTSRMYRALSETSAIFASTADLDDEVSR